MRREISSPRSSLTSIITEYSEAPALPECRMVPSTLSGHSTGRATCRPTASKRRWRRQAGHVSALRRMRSPQCGHFHASPPIVGANSVRRVLRAVLRWPRLAFTLLPAELHLAAHLGSGGDHHAAGLHVADQRAGVLELYPRRRGNLTPDIAGHQDRFGRDLALDVGPRLDGQLAVHLDGALEPADHAKVAAALDLPLDREPGGQNGFGIVHAARRHLRALHSWDVVNGNRRARERRLERRLGLRLGLGLRRGFVLPGRTELEHVSGLLGTASNTAGPTYYTRGPALCQDATGAGAGPGARLDRACRGSAQLVAF